MTTPLPITQTFFSRKIPEGTRWSTYFFGPIKTVWPALLPPWVRTTMSACSVRTSMIFPFPSSPHWAPTKIVFAIAIERARTIKNPEIVKSGRTLGIYGRTLGNVGWGVNAIFAAGRAKQANLGLPLQGKILMTKLRFTGGDCGTISIKTDVVAQYCRSRSRLFMWEEGSA